MTEAAQLTLVAGSKKWHALRRRARNDLYWFAAKVLQHESIFPMTEQAHLPMCRFAERKTGIPAVDGARIQLIQVARGLGKSLNVTKARSLQRLVQNQDWCIGIANERQDNANAFLGMIKAEFESNVFLQALFPECIPDFKKTEWRADRIVINRTRPNPVNPSVLATGTGGTVTGVHMNEWIIDDMISQDAAENARAGSFEEIMKTNRWIDRLQPLLNSPKADPITFIGTPWWVGDCYDYVVELFGHGEKPQTYVWTIDLPSGGRATREIVVVGELAIFRQYPVYDNIAVWPEGGHTIEALNMMLQENPEFAAAQYFLKPSLGDASDFKEEWLRKYEWESDRQLTWKDDEQRTKFERLGAMDCVMSVDPAISKKKNANKTAITITHTDGKNIFLTRAYAARMTATETANKVIEFYQKYHPRIVLIEEVAYQSALQEVIELRRREVGIEDRLPIEPYKTGSQDKKNIRIKGLEPYFRKGLLRVHSSQVEFLAQYRTFPQNKDRDLLDALSFQKPQWERVASSGGSDRDKEYADKKARHVAKIRNKYSRNRRWQHAD